MARTKFVVFVAVTVVLAIVGLANLGSRVSSLASVQSDERLAWGKLLFETSGRLSQAYRTAAFEAAASDPSLRQVAATLKDAAPSPGVIAAGQKVAAATLEKSPHSVFLIGNEKGVAAISSGEGNLKLEEQDSYGLIAAGQAGPEGGFARVDGKIYRVASAPIKVTEAGAEKVVGWLGAAFPLDDAFAKEQSTDLKMHVALVAGNAVVASSLPSNQRSKIASQKSGYATLDSSLPSLGFIQLPLFAGDAQAAKALRFELKGIGAQAVLITDAPTLRTLAEFQRSALLGILALIALSITFAVLIGSSEPTERFERIPERLSYPELTSNRRRDEALPVAPTPGPATISPDDFPFGNSKQGAATSSTQPAAVPTIPQPPEPPASENAVASVPDFGQFGQLEEPSSAQQALVAEHQAPSTSSLDSSGETTQTAPTSGETFPAAPSVGPEQPVEKPYDPFLAASQTEPEAPPAGESTVVATVPEELLRAAARRSNAVPLPPPPAVDGNGNNGEEEHFQEVFENFLSTRAQCNEPAEGLTFDRFSAKLRKNRDQLMQKYNCKSVRFQVYVKDGKAALKASPVKE